MSEEIKHWAASLEVGDRVKVTIRHENDGSKNIIDQPAIVVENMGRVLPVLKVSCLGKMYTIPFNELKPI